MYGSPGGPAEEGRRGQVSSLGKGSETGTCCGDPALVTSYHRFHVITASAPRPPVALGLQWALQ